MSVDSLCQTSGQSIVGIAYSVPQCPGLHLGRLIWLGLDSSGGFSTHISGAWAGMIQRLGSAGIVHWSAYTCLLHVAWASPIEWLVLSIQRGSTANPDREHYCRTRQRDPASSSIMSLLRGKAATDPTRFKEQDTQTLPLYGRRVKEFSAICKSTTHCVAMPDGSAGWI